MGVFSIKDSETDDQARVVDGALWVTPVGGGSLNNVNIFDSDGNPLTSTGGALNVNDGGVGWSSFGQSTPKQVTVNDTSTVLLNANPDRLYAKFSNNSQQTIYLQYGINAVWQEGQILFPNQTWTITTIELFLGQVNGITLTGSIQLDVIEGVS